MRRTYSTNLVRSSKRYNDNINDIDYYNYRSKAEQMHNENRQMTSNFRNLINRSKDPKNLFQIKPEFKVDRKTFYSSRDKHDIHSYSNATTKVNKSGNVLFFNYEY